MTALSELFPSSAIESIQEGYVAVASLTAGSGEDAHYTDVTISAVVIAKSVAVFEGIAGNNAGYPTAYTISSGVFGREPTARLTSTTNLRIASAGGTTPPTHMTGRWKVVEYK